MNKVVKFSLQLLFVLALFTILLVYAMFQGGFVSWFLFYAFLPILLYHLGFLLHPMGRWKAERDIFQKQITTGENITLTIRLKRFIPYPLYYLIVEEQLPNTLDHLDSPYIRYHHFAEVTERDHRHSLKQVVYPWFKRTIQCSFTLDYLPRGEHQLQSVRVRTGDVFGFIKHEHVFQMEDTLVVQPARRPLHLLEQKKGSVHGDAVASGTSMEQTNVVTGVRAYTPGDKLSWIDWKQTARKSEIMTKEFEQEQQMGTVVILDACAYDELNPAAFEAAIEVGLSMMEKMRYASTRAGFLSLGTDCFYSPVYQNRHTISQIHNHLIRIQPVGAESFATMLKTHIDRVDGQVAIIITSYLHTGLEHVLSRMRQRVVMVYIQAQDLISEHERGVLYHLRAQGVIVNELTEKELVQNRIEVGI